MAICESKSDASLLLKDFLLQAVDWGIYTVRSGCICLSTYLELMSVHTAGRMTAHDTSSLSPMLISC